MTGELPATPGSYALVFRNPVSRRVRVGALGDVEIRPGFLIYVGSAFGPGGIRARVTRHARTTKKLRWHIDYLRRCLSLEEVWLTTATERLEHAWADRLGTELDVAWPRFGASDCRCATHLFFSPEHPTIALIDGDILLFPPRSVLTNDLY